MLFTIWRQWRRRSSAAQARRERSWGLRRTLPGVEHLERRDLLSTFSPFFILSPAGGPSGPFSSPGPSGYTPSQMTQAYGFNQINFNGTKGDGTGQTIALVDAYDDPTAAGDLQQFDKQFGLPDPTFTKVNQNGGSTLPQADAGWAEEISLDVQWAHAIAPGANILLVEANSNSDSDLFTAVQYAASQPGVAAVSMSWGGGEFSSESSFDNVFTTPQGHSGVVFIASSGDSGAPVSYPAASPNVLSVGGTSLFLDGNNNYSSESGWSGSGGGISAFEAQPTYQKGVVTQSTTRRTNPDVSYDADPNTGVPVYDSYTFGTSNPWAQFGGTSAAAPQWAALIAIADQGRALNGTAALDGPTLLSDVYSLPGTDFHDITTGTSTGNPHYSAGPGYDLVTGRGTPVANLLVSDLVGQSQTVGATHFGVTANVASATAGNSFTITVSALDSSGNVDPTYAGTVHFTSSDPSAELPSDYTFSSTDAGTATFTVTLFTAGNQTITATDTANNSFTGKTSVTVTPAAADHLAFGQQPTNVVVGSSISPAVTVRVLDAYGNLETGDNSDQVTVALGSNPGGATLSGTTTATVTGGVATFSNLSLDQPGNGYTLTAAANGLTGATSSTFNVTTSSTNVIEDFEHSDTWNIVGGPLNAFLSTAAAHDGTYGLDQYNGNTWMYRNDSGAQVQAGDTLSVWLQFSGAANGRAYFGFGAGPGGTLSLVAAPNSNQLIIQRNINYGFTNLAAVTQTYQANHWYRLEVDWGKSGKIVGKLYDSDGTTLLKTVTATTTVITSGGIAFRSTGNDKFYDTVTDTPGVNSFVLPSGSQTAEGAGGLPAQGAAGGGAGAAEAVAVISSAPAAVTAADHVFASSSVLPSGADGLTAPLFSGVGLPAQENHPAAAPDAGPALIGQAAADYSFALTRAAQGYSHRPGADWDDLGS